MIGDSIISDEIEIDVLSVTPGPQPIDNEKKYFCQRCLNHGKEFPRKGHKPKCEYSHCQCKDCSMVETRRVLNNTLSKNQKKNKKPKVDGRKVRDPHCARCGAHGVENPLRGHKKEMCAYYNCKCELCELVQTRRSVMARQIKLRRDQKKQREMEGRKSVDSCDDSLTSNSNSNSPLPTSFVTATAPESPELVVPPPTFAIPRPVLPQQNHPSNLVAFQSSISLLPTMLPQPIPVNPNLFGLFIWQHQLYNTSMLPTMSAQLYAVLQKAQEYQNEK